MLVMYIPTLTVSGFEDCALQNEMFKRSGITKQKAFFILWFENESYTTIIKKQDDFFFIAKKSSLQASCFVTSF